jgi:sterol desaturase/sphingolipid hydroxylase (fatty acid hydroxylase superfamily)
VDDLLINFHSDIYTAAFFGAIILVAIWESAAPRRDNGAQLRRRWVGNIALAALNFSVLYLVFPVAAVGFSLVIESQNFGVLRWVGVPLWLAALIGYLAIDFARYLQHYLLHRISFLWRFHRIHHADPDIDFTVGLRFHPVEALFTVTFVFGVIALLGPPPMAVLAAEVCAAISGMIVHANGRAPNWAERVVRPLFVTPDMHRIHHSVDRREHNSNFSVVYSFWDRLCGTYLASPAAPQVIMKFGLPDLRAPECLTLRWMLVSPFKNFRPSGEAKNKGEENPLSD